MEIDQFVANAKAKADAVEIPHEPFDLNIVDEVRKAIRSGDSSWHSQNKSGWMQAQLRWFPNGSSEASWRKPASWSNTPA
jgi:hypothetical protein